MCRHGQNKDKYEHVIFYFHVCKDFSTIKYGKLKYVFTIWRGFLEKCVTVLENIILV